VQREALEPLSGDVRTIGYAGRLRSFAMCCGTSLFFEDHEGCASIDVAIASLDDPGRSAPEAAIWLEDRLAWVPIAPEIQKHEHGRPSPA
jgi:hypothetical protein